MKLVVVRPFGPHAKGDVVDNPAQMADVLASEFAGSVVRVFTPDAPSRSVEKAAPAPAATVAAGKEG